MKYTLFIITLVLISLSLSAQRAPGKVRKAFESRYPGNPEVKWEYAGDQIREWTAAFQIEGDSAAATYDHKGNWLLTLRFIPLDELPQTVADAVLEEYQGGRLVLAAIYEEPGFEGYGVAFQYKKDRWGVQVSREGKIIRRRLTSEGFDF